MKIGLYFWFMNIMSILMSTRGSADTIISSLVLLTIYLVIKKNYLAAGLIFGLAIHFKVYPIILSLLVYLYIGWDKSFFNKDSIMFAITTITSLSFWTSLFYYIYGYTFLYESTLYHF